MNTLLDVGCNNLDGFRLLSRIEPIIKDCRKIFVEANPECWEDLTEDIKQISNSFLIKKAVADRVGEMTLATRPDETKCTGATIMGDSFLRDSLNRWDIRVPNFKYYTVPTTTIREIISEYNIDPHESIFKLDAEGIEYHLLQSLIDENIIFKKIYCEFHVHNHDDQNNKHVIIGKLQSMGCDISEWH